MAGAVKRLNGSLRALRQHLLLGDERAVEIHNHQGDLAFFTHLLLCVLAQIEEPPGAAIPRQQLLSRRRALAAGGINRKILRRTIR